MYLLACLFDDNGLLVVDTPIGKLDGALSSNRREMSFGSITLVTSFKIVFSELHALSVLNLKFGCLNNLQSLDSRAQSSVSTITSSEHGPQLLPHKVCAFFFVQFYASLLRMNPIYFYWTLILAENDMCSGQVVERPILRCREIVHEAVLPSFVLFLGYFGQTIIEFKKDSFRDGFPLPPQTYVYLLQNWTKTIKGSSCGHSESCFLRIKPQI